MAPFDRKDDFVFHTKSTWAREIRNVADEEDAEALKISLGAVFSSLYSICDKWQSESRTLWSPQLWTPNAQRNERIVLSQSVGGILMALQREQIDLRQVSWHHLEEIVAELLRAFGMEVHVVRNRLR